MKVLFQRGFAIAVLAFAGATAAVAADQFPSKPIHIIVTSAPGGYVDVTTRLIARQMGDKLGQPIIVENRSGAGGLVAMRGVKTAPADGYTLLAVVNTIAIQQVVSQDPGYDVTKDFVGVGAVTRAPFLLVVGSNQPDKSLTDLISRAKANPGKLTYASAGNGSTTHFAAALFAQRAGVDLLHVPYKGNSAAWPDLIGRRVGVLFEAYPTSISMIRDGRLKALGVTSTKRLDILPEVPTIAELGVPYNFYLWVGLFAPAATPKDIVQKLSLTLQSTLTDKDLQKRFREEGSEVMTMPSEEFNKFVTSEVAAMTKLATDINLPKQ